LLNAAEELLDFHRHGQEAIAAQDSGRHELAFRNRVAQAKQRDMAKITIFLKLPGNDLSVSGDTDEIDHDQVGLKPMRGVKSKCGIVFLADGILADVFESPANRASNVRLVIDEKNFFTDLHEIASYSEHRLCQQLVPAATLRVSGFSRARLNQRKLDTVLMVSARITVLKPNDNIPCTSTNHRISRDVTFTSETWQVMPMTNEK
jgi:hypothetical protein